VCWHLQEELGGMSYVTAIGLGAAFCTTIAFLPQAIKTWRTRSTKDISLGMFLIFSIGIALWLIYGLLQHDIPLIAANGITLVLALIILGLKIRHG
jgi:MtN3 and saliva related transmembrane protein